MSRIIRTLDGILGAIDWLGQLARRLRGLPPMVVENPKPIEGMGDSTREHIRKEIESATTKYRVPPNPSWAERPPGAVDWNCDECKQLNSWWATECGRCEKKRVIQLSGV